MQTMLEWLRGLNALGVVARVSAAEQIVGRERRECVSQLPRCGGGCFDSRRRVNSTIRHLFLMGIDKYPEQLGTPDIKLGGLQVWVHGRQFPDAIDYWDGNWLRITAH